MNSINSKYFFFNSSAAFLLCFLFHFNAPAQSFADRCAGKWKGVMDIYLKNKKINEVAVILDVSKKNDSTWKWTTSYLSKDKPLVKDYNLIAQPGSNIFKTDEGDGVVLLNYLFNNKLYSVFETHGVMLTSFYEMIDDSTLLFEVTSGSKMNNEGEVINYSVNNLQRVIFKKENK